MFLTDFIGKKVFSYEGKLLGYTRCACFSENLKKVTALLCSDDEEEDFTVPFSSKKIGDAVILPKKNSRAATAPFGVPFSPLARQVYSEVGAFLGVVSDMLLEKSTPTYLIVGEKRYSVADVTAFGDCILLRLRGKSAAETGVDLFGKTVTRDLTDGDGKVIFPKGTVVSPAVLKSAVLRKRLVELTATTFCE